MKFLLGSSVILAILATYGVVEAEIGGDLISTLRILYNLCHGGKDEPGVPEKFFACYDPAPGKEIFVKCQLEAFGCLMDNVENITKTCNKLDTMIPYTKCLQEDFANAGLNLTASATIVNICQAGVLGIE